tara:strand:- start:1192 stop:1368 length:177 start_codon:yes stop_codon:yes gene_type:complete
MSKYEKEGWIIIHEMNPYYENCLENFTEVLSDMGIDVVTSEDEEGTRIELTRKEQDDE